MLCTSVIDFYSVAPDFRLLRGSETWLQISKLSHSTSAAASAQAWAELLAAEVRLDIIQLAVREDIAHWIASYFFKAEMSVQTVITTPTGHGSQCIWPSARQSLPFLKMLSMPFPLPLAILGCCLHSHPAILAPAKLHVLLQTYNVLKPYIGQCSPRSHGHLSLSVNPWLLGMAGLQPSQQERARWHVGWHVGLLCTFWRCTIWWHCLLRDLRLQKLLPTPAVNEEQDVPAETPGALQCKVRVLGDGTKATDGQEEERIAPARWKPVRISLAMGSAAHWLSPSLGL